MQPVCQRDARDMRMRSCASLSKTTSLVPTQFEPVNSGWFWTYASMSCVLARAKDSVCGPPSALAALHTLKRSVCIRPIG